MKQVIEGKVYNTETATQICELPCRHHCGDFQWHDTALYKTKKGAYFLAGKGGPMSMWARPSYGGVTGSSGIKVVNANEARGWAECADLNAEEMTAAGFAVEEA